MLCLRIATFFWIVGMLTACDNAIINKQATHKLEKSAETDEKSITVLEEGLKAEAAKKAQLESLAHSIAEDKAKVIALTKKIELTKKKTASSVLTKTKVADKTSETQKYIHKIETKVSSNWIVPADKHGSCSIYIKLTPKGQAIGQANITCSGNDIFKHTAEDALKRSLPLPVPADKKLFEQKFSTLIFNIHR